MTRFFAFALVAALTQGCVSKSKYAEMEARFDQCHERLEKARGKDGSPHAELLAQLKPLVDKGLLEVTEIDGRTVIAMRSEVLFGSGSATLSDDGSHTVRDVATVLAKNTTAEWQVEGHTDDEPIASAEFPSNWHLGSARAIAVVQTMIAAGMAPNHLSAATFAEFSPVAANTSADGKAQNRRIEIVLLPEIHGGRRLKK